MLDKNFESDNSIYTQDAPLPRDIKEVNRNSFEKFLNGQKDWLNSVLLRHLGNILQYWKSISDWRPTRWGRIQKILIISLILSGRLREINSEAANRPVPHKM